MLPGASTDTGLYGHIVAHVLPSNTAGMMLGAAFRSYPNADLPLAKIPLPSPGAALRALWLS